MMATHSKTRNAVQRLRRAARRRRAREMRRAHQRTAASRWSCSPPEGEGPPP